MDNNPYLPYLVGAAALGGGVGYLVGGSLGLVVGLVAGPLLLVAAFLAVIAMVYDR